MLLVDHFFALGSPMRPSAPDKKSFSIANCPILACSSLMSGPVSAFLSLENTSSAPSNSCFFHSVIWLGCTWNLSASYTRVCPSFSASTATFALNAALWFLLGLLLIQPLLWACYKDKMTIPASPFALYGAIRTSPDVWVSILEQLYHLCPCPVFPGQLSQSSRDSD